ncbi:DUF2523 domain-containing protein [Undibacterium sp. CY18W]|uniref:DUF2523 domain-containing protein n=1 Tax=Undibacterium hunanense TaxID=2762292 RepID=A0ABR6ZNF5_9BURK|nr:DUF2523 domain-containing protein [Undibacterium hunanense]MBC3917108.1 DUF2523 domain-containing protein [Undibacterium hunanense]
MPFLIAALWGAFASILGSLVGRVLIALGISYVTYKGVTVGTDSIVMTMKNAYGGMGGEIGSFVQWLWIDKALSMIVSAFAAAMAIKSGSGAITKMVIKK